MQAKHARQIRAGIMSKCWPYMPCTCPGANCVTIDFGRLWTNLLGAESSALAKRAANRTRPWDSRPKANDNA